MTTSTDAFHGLGRLLLPAGEDRVVQAPSVWSTGTVPAPPAVWGQPAALSGRGAPQLLRRAVARERALRSLPGGAHGAEVRAVHRLAPSGHHRGGLRGRVRDWMLSGAAAELRARGDDRPNLLDVALRAAGVQPAGRLHAGSGGGATTVVTHDGQQAVARVGLARSPGDPAPEAAVLRRLQDVAVAPIVLATGETRGASWLVESRLPGRVPRRVDTELAVQVATVWSGLPRVPGPPRAHHADLDTLRTTLPDHAAAWHRLRAWLDHVLRDVPALLRHGDLWRGNLLVDRGRLTGVVDWDACAAAGTPGTDLLQLVATELRHDRSWSLGRTWAGQPWRHHSFAAATAGYWERVGFRLDPPLLEAVGRCWWLAEVAGTLRRRPERAVDAPWLRDNVEPVLAAFSRGA